LEGAVLWTQQLEWGNGEGVHIPSPPCPRPLISRHGGPWQDLRMPHLGGAGLGSAGWAGLGVRADVAGQGLAPREPLRRRGPLPCRAFWPESTAGTECTNGRRRRARSGSAAGPVAAPASVRTTDRQGARGERRRMGCWRLPSLVRFEPCPTRKPAGPGRAGSVEGRALGRRVLRSRAGSAGLRRRPVIDSRLGETARHAPQVAAGSMRMTSARAAPAHALGSGPFRVGSEQRMPAGRASESRIRVTWSNARGGCAARPSPFGRGARPSPFHAPPWKRCAAVTI
jgi:hypothetical protein